VCCPEYPRKGTCSQPPGSRQPLTRVTVHGLRTALRHLDRTRVLLSRPSWLCGNGEHYEKVPGLDITKVVAVPPWLQKAPFGGVCTSSEVGIPPHRTFASLGFVHLGLSSSLPAGAGDASSSVADGQDPVYYAALVSRGGWCMVRVSFLPPTFQLPPVIPDPLKAANPAVMHMMSGFPRYISC